MISFRFHLVSLIAVFLALGLGVIAGTTVINRAIVSQLQDQTEQLAAQEEENRAAISRLEGEVETAADFAEQVSPYLLDGRLAARDVVVVTEEGADRDAIDGVSGALAEARADLDALLALDNSLALLSESQRAELAATLGFDAESDADGFAAQVASALADRLTFGPQAGEPDVLTTLMEEGYLVNEGPPLDEAGLRALDPDGFVVVGGGAVAEGSSLLVPLVEALAEDGTPVVGVEGVDAAQPFVEELRGALAADAISTQDNVDQVFGQIGLVLALSGVLDGAEPGHYGIKDGATSVIPPPA